jgi:hypothetical protein
MYNNNFMDNRPLLIMISGVKKDIAMYQVGGMSTDIVISISNYHKDIKLSSLSDDDFRDVIISLSIFYFRYYLVPT